MKKYIYSRTDKSRLTRYQEWRKRRENSTYLYNKAYFDFDLRLTDWCDHVTEELANTFDLSPEQISIDTRDSGKKVEIVIDTEYAHITLKNQNDMSDDIKLDYYAKNGQNYNIMNQSYASILQRFSALLLAVSRYNWTQLFSTRPTNKQYLESLDDLANSGVPNPESDEFINSIEELEGIQYLVEESIGKDMWFPTWSYGYNKFIDMDETSYKYINWNSKDIVRSINKDDILHLSIHINDLGDTLSTQELQEMTNRR